MCLLNSKVATRGEEEEECVPNISRVVFNNRNKTLKYHTHVLKKGGRLMMSHDVS